MAEVTLYHNPKCSTSRHALEEVEASGVDADVVQYLKTPLDEAQLRDLLDILEDEPADLVRKDKRFAELGLDAADFTDVDSVVELLVREPVLMQRPILVRGGRAIIGRPKDRVPGFLG